MGKGWVAVGLSVGEDVDPSMVHPALRRERVQVPRGPRRYRQGDSVLTRQGARMRHDANGGRSVRRRPRRRCRCGRGARHGRRRPSTRRSSSSWPASPTARAQRPGRAAERLPGRRSRAGSTASTGPWPPATGPQWPTRPTPSPAARRASAPGAWPTLCRELRTVAAERRHEHAPPAWCGTFTTSSSGSARGCWPSEAGHERRRRRRRPPGPAGSGPGRGQHGPRLPARRQRRRPRCAWSRRTRSTSSSATG